MPAPASALGYINTSVKYRIIPRMIDQVTKTNTTFQAVNANMKFLDGGDYIVQPILTTIPSAFAIAYSGNDTFPVNTQENEQGAVYDWKLYGISVDLTGMDEVRNDGIEAAINLTRVRMEEAEIALRDRFGIDLQSDGTNFGGKSLLGFQIAIDNGTNYNTYAGVSRSAFPVWKSFISSNGGTARALTIQLIDNAVQNTSWDNDTPNFFVTSLGGVTRLSQLMMPILRTDNSEVVSTSFRAVRYRGYPVVPDMQVQTSPTEKFVGLNMRYAQMYYRKGRYFRWVPFQRQGAQDMITGKILTACCFVVARPASFFSINDLNTALG